MATVSLPGVEARRLPPGEFGYPRTFREFSEWFSDEVACRDYLMRLRWRDGFCCPACGVSSQPWRLGDGRLRCPVCRRKVSVLAGTIFADTKLPLQTWFAAAWYVTNQKSGASALGLQRVLAIGSYRTAWALLHKLRRAMVRPGRDQLRGEIEIDETYIGGAGSARRGRSLGQAIAVIAVEIRPGGRSGRIRLARVPDCSEPTLTDVVSALVEAGSVVYTDGWKGYNGLTDAGFVHVRTSLQASGDPAHVVMPRAHRVASLLKRWLLGTHHGGMRARHLDYYLDEFTFRFNRRSSSRRGLLFFRLLEQAVQIDPVPINSIIGGRP